MSAFCDVRGYIRDCGERAEGAKHPTVSVTAAEKGERERERERERARKQG